MSQTLSSELISAHEWHPLSGHQAPEYIPPSWIGPHVGLRMKEGFETLARMPVQSGPGTFKTLWPAYQYEVREYFANVLALVTEGYTPAEHELVTDRNRVRLSASAQAIQRMETVICWPARYLRHGPQLMRMVLSVALGRSRGMDLGQVALKLKRGPSFLRDGNRRGLDMIAEGLRRDGVGVF